MERRWALCSDLLQPQSYEVRCIWDPLNCLGDVFWYRSAALKRRLTKLEFFLRPICLLLSTEMEHLDESSIF